MDFLLGGASRRPAYTGMSGMAFACSPLPTIWSGLTIAHFALQPNGAGYGIVGQPVLLGEVKDEDSERVLYARATLEPLIHRVLNTAGYDINRTGHISRPLPPPRLKQPPHHDPLDHCLLLTVQRHDAAVIRYDANAVDPARLIAQVALAWPDQTIAVVVRYRNQARELRNCLCYYGVPATLADGKHHADAGSRMTVSTPMGLAVLPTDVAWLDIVIALDAVEATGKRDIECMVHASRARFYGLLATDARPSPLERDLVYALFGFQQVLIPRHGCHERPVQIVPYPIRGGVRLPMQLGGIQLKRRGLWHHAAHNRKLAQFATTLAAGNTDKWQAMFGGIAGVTIASPANVLLLCENVEHALALARQLPIWPLFAGTNIHEVGLSAEQVRRLHMPPDPYRTGPLHVIATTASIDDVDLAEIDVIVRADGGVGLPPFDLDKLAESDKGGSRPLVLVDCLDLHHPILRRQSRRRQQAYAERGWFAPVADPVQSRVQRFLASLPGGANERQPDAPLRFCP